MIEVHQQTRVKKSKARAVRRRRGPRDDQENTRPQTKNKEEAETKSGHGEEETR